MHELAPVSRVVPPPPPRWEVEWKVVELASETALVDRGRVTAQSRLLEDLQFDSLDTVEFIMALEAQFPVGLSDKVCQEFFVGRSITLETITELVLHVWGTAPPDRSRWRRRQAPLPAAESLPFTQLDGACALQDWQTGQLFEPIGRNREGFRQFRRRTDGMRCVEIPGAEATIGCPLPEAPEDQRPLHQVELSPFLLDAEPVSNAAYARFLNSVGRVPAAVLAEWCGAAVGDKRAAQFPLEVGFRHVWRPRPGTERQPMMLVSWYGANAYSLWANRLDWRTYRGDGRVPDELAGRQFFAPPPPQATLGAGLPSEAQWEYAARGAAPFDPSAGAPEQASVCAGLHRSGDTYFAETIPARPVNELLGMSPFGLHHMAGNVWQWCRDFYAPDFYLRPEASQPDAQNSEPTNIRNERGGSWVGPESLANPSYRRGRPPAVRGRCLGFRCVGLMRDLP